MACFVQFVHFKFSFCQELVKEADTFEAMISDLKSETKDKWLQPDEEEDKLEHLPLLLAGRRKIRVGEKGFSREMTCFIERVFFCERMFHIRIALLRPTHFEEGQSVKMIGCLSQVQHLSTSSNPQ